MDAERLAVGTVFAGPRQDAAAFSGQKDEGGGVACHLGAQALALARR